MLASNKLGKKKLPVDFGESAMHRHL